MLGAFLAYTQVAVLHLPFYLASITTVLICAVFGVVLDYVAYRPLRTAPRLAALITAIGVSIFLQNLALLIWGSQIKAYPREVLPSFFYTAALSAGDVILTWLQIFILAVTVVSMLVLHFIIHKSKVGTAMRAVSQDKVASALMGIGVNRVISVTFAIGSAMGGMAGILVGLYYNAIFPTMGYIAGVKAFAAAVLGGIGSVPGAMLGGTVLGIAEVLGAGYFSSSYRDGISYAVMILVIIFKPSGLIGQLSGDKV
jgi:branched-chain amino acid transport system permease protein